MRCKENDSIATDVKKMLVTDYISKLYAKIWNEAVLCNQLDITCSIVCDHISAGAGMQRLEDLHLVTTLTDIYRDNDIDNSISEEDINEARKSINLLPIRILSTQDITDKIDTVFSDASNSGIYCFDFYGFNQPQMPTFPRVALGGTFDRLHNGHRKLLNLAVCACQGQDNKLIVGITGTSMLEKKANAGMINSFEVRKTGVIEFVRSLKNPASLELDIVELKDPFGPTISDPSLQAIVVSSETLVGAAGINKKRIESGMKPLAILMTLRSDSAVLSSSFIRNKTQTSTS